MIKNSFKGTTIKNIEIFDNLYCYTLGFIWADGYIRPIDNNFSIEIVEEDSKELHSIFCNKINWNIYYRERPNRQKQITFSKTDGKLKRFLVDLDYDKKSYTSPDKIINLLSEMELKYFIRGYFDGDGCIYSNNKSSTQLSFTSSLEQNWDFLIKIFKNLEITFSIRKVKNKNSYSQLRITNKQHICKFYEFFYLKSNDKYLGLSRKYKKLENIYNMYNNIKRINKKSIGKTTFINASCVTDGKMGKLSSEGIIIEI